MIYFNNKLFSSDGKDPYTEMYDDYIRGGNALGQREDFLRAIN